MQNSKLKIGIVGCGAIGSSLAKAILKDFLKLAVLVALYDIDLARAQYLSKIISQDKSLITKSLKQLINKSELVIEAASAKSSWEIAQDVLINGRSIMIMSIGGIVNHFKELSGLAERYNSKVYLPSGAISGIDALKAAKLGGIKKVILTTRKNPVSFKEIEYVTRKKINLDKIKKDTLLFSGSAKVAVKHFPGNINVAGLLSIAGRGENKTQVKIIASPKINKNIHEIKIESEAANISTCIENILHPDNPKTSYLAVLSAMATLKQILEPVKIGT